MKVLDEKDRWVFTSWVDEERLEEFRRENRRHGWHVIDVAEAGRLMKANLTESKGRLDHILRNR